MILSKIWREDRKKKHAMWKGQCGFVICWDRQLQNNSRFMLDIRVSLANVHFLRDSQTPLIYSVCPDRELRYEPHTPIINNICDKTCRATATLTLTLKFTVPRNWFNAQHESLNDFVRRPWLVVCIEFVVIEVRDKARPFQRVWTAPCFQSLIRSQNT